MRAKYSVPQAVTDFRELLGDPEIDAVVVATKEDMQATLAVEAMKAGKHVYVEKPLADTPEAARLVAETQAETGRFACVGFNRRMAPAYRLAKRVVAGDGGPKNIHYRISDEYWSWGKNMPPGVRVIHEVCHIFDILRWFTDSDPTSIYTVAARPDDEIFVLTFASGAVASIMSSGYVTMDMPKERIELVSELGSVVVEEMVECRTYGFPQHEHIHRFAGHSHPEADSTHKYLLEVQGREALESIRRMGWELRERAKQPHEESLDGVELDTVLRRAPTWNYMVDKGWLSAIDHFAECVAHGTRPELARAEDGLWSARMSAAAIESRESGSVVRF
jgi:predicted dehydrogenase